MNPERMQRIYTATVLMVFLIVTATVFWIVAIWAPKVDRFILVPSQNPCFLDAPQGTAYNLVYDLATGRICKIIEVDGDEKDRK